MCASDCASDGALPTYKCALSAWYCIMAGHTFARVACLTERLVLLHLRRALFTWTLSPVEQACMAYLPTAKAFWQRQAIARVVIALGIGIAFGVAALLAGLLLGCPGILVKDHAVQPLIGLVAIQVWWDLSTWY